MPGRQRCGGGGRSVGRGDGGGSRDFGEPVRHLPAELRIELVRRGEQPQQERLSMRPSALSNVRLAGCEEKGGSSLRVFGGQVVGSNEQLCGLRVIATLARLPRLAMLAVCFIYWLIIGWRRSGGSGSGVQHFLQCLELGLHERP